MSPIILSALAAVALCVAMLLCLEIGMRIGTRRLREDPSGEEVGVGALTAAVFSLLGLLLAFAFSDASKRFDERRRQIVQEVNDIGTAWLRVSLLPAAAQPGLRTAFRNYVDARIEIYSQPVDDIDRREQVARASALQLEVWNLAVSACTKPDGEGARLLLLPAMNTMFDTASTRLSMARMHPPLIVFGMLIALALTSAVLAGISLAPAKHRKWAHLIGYSMLISATIYLIVDIEFPRRGLVRIDSFDQMLIDLRKSMD
jgi:hypothetical protein